MSRGIYFSKCSFLGKSSCHKNTTKINKFTIFFLYYHRTSKNCPLRWNHYTLLLHTCFPLFKTWWTIGRIRFNPLSVSAYHNLLQDTCSDLVHVFWLCGRKTSKKSIISRVVIKSSNSSIRQGNVPTTVF